MILNIAELIVVFAMIYVAFGILVAGILIFLWPERLDSVISQSTRGFRVIIFPGAMLLWPLLFLRAFVWGPGPPIEKTAHRRAAGLEQG